MSISSNKKGQVFNEINITPLTDIFLVLLIIMMVIAPMFQAVDNNIKLPSINSGLSVDEKEITVAVTKEAEFFVNGTKAEEKELAEKLKAILPQEEGAEKKVVVKADSSTKTKEIMKVMNAAKEAGYEKLTVAGEPLTTGQQDELKENSKLDKSVEKPIEKKGEK